MLKTKNYRYYPIEISKDGKVILTNFRLNSGDCIGIPISFSQTKLNNYIRIVREAIDDRIIYITDKKDYSMVFNVMENHNFTYNQWKYLIEFAKKNNINFFVNILEEYTPEEMENYVEKFARTYKNNRRKLVFNNDSFFVNRNPIINESEEIFKYVGICPSISVSSLDKNEIDDYVTKQRNKGLYRLDFLFKDGKNITEVDISNVKNIINYVKETYSNEIFDISFSCNFQFYTKEQFELLMGLEEYIKKEYNDRYELEFLSCDTVINKQQILNANSKIDEVVEYLKTSNLSPYEKVIYVHKLLSEKAFYENKDNNTLSRNIYTILNSRNIVSVGYSMLMNTILNELNDENIKCSSELINMNNGTFNLINCIYLKDDKYEIEGYYKIDPTVNSGSDDLKRFMIPSQDYENISDVYGYVEAGPAISCGNIMRNCHYFKNHHENDYGDYLSRILDWNERIENINENTLNFLDDNSRNDVLSQIEKDKKTHPTFYILETIKKCVEETKAIPASVTRDAIATVAYNCYGMDEKSSQKYANNLVIRNAFNSLFEYNRKQCSGGISNKSLDIENGNAKITSRKI